MENNKKKLQIPSTCALLFMLMIVCAILTWIVPAGEFDTEKVDNLNKVIAGTYHTVEASPVGPWATIMAVVQGFYKAAKLMVMVMFVGGAVEILEKTGAIHAAFGKLASKQNLNVNVLVFLVMAFMSIGGAAGVFANAVVALIPIGIILATNLGYDSFTGFLLVYIGAYSGFNVGWANASTIGTAQPIAELPIFSGFSVRVVLNIINFAICYFFTIRYMKTIKADPKKSLNYEDGMSASDSMGAGKDGAKAIEAHLTTKHLISLIGLVVAVAAILVGSVKYKWSYDQIAATFFTLAVVVGLLNGMGINGTTKVFIGGCSKMVNAAFIVGFANGISVILASGNILNTIVYCLFIPSGSGQAAAVMPLMVPVADLAGITRQVAVQAFQFGDGFSNCLFPTAGTLMGSLAIAKTDWTKYAKWLMPLLGCQVILSFVSLTILQSIGWTGL